MIVNCFEINVYHDGKKTESLTGTCGRWRSVEFALDSFLNLGHDGRRGSVFLRGHRRHFSLWRLLCSSR